MKLGVRCTTPSCSNIAIVDDTESRLKALCPKCGYCSHDEMDLEESLRLMDMIKWRSEQLQNHFQSGDYCAMYDQGKRLLKLVKESILHPCNIRNVQVLDKLFDSCLQLEKFDEACDYVSQTIQAYE
uniref:Uncharacterized protein n=1 Tax=Romanomermis culicivorax TaxID=13658 RepID=A0A915KTM7_ROMCU